MATNTSDNIDQLFVLGRFIASDNIPVHFLCLADRNQDLKLRVQGDLRASNIHFHDILVPSSLAEIEYAGDAFARYSLLRQSINDILDDDHDKMIRQMQDEFPLLESSGAQFATMLLRKLNLGEIMNSCRELEGKYLDLLANAKDKPWLAVGPLHMLLESHDSNNKNRHECLEFLDKQDVNSVIFVFFWNNRYILTRASQ
ncbi:zeatin O-glucosyltransferase-like [Nicotiana tomentosiformis]|uniref:zeatin O-glucosyltransferase-like n=1 Tax=Nicotiana tomentosiformis TaxID=4098 RepID=UPI00051AE0F9